jgi:hypothetical protein
MNNTAVIQMKYVGIVLIFSLSLFATCLCSAASTDTSSDTTTSSTTSDTTSSTSTGLPLGKEAIDYVISINPGKAVEAAVSGTPIFQGKMFQQPTDEPDFWDNIKTIFLDGLAQAITNVTGIAISTSTSTTAKTVSPAGQ